MSLITYICKRYLVIALTLIITACSTYSPTVNNTPVEPSSAIELEAYSQPGSKVAVFEQVLPEKKENTLAQAPTQKVVITDPPITDLWQRIREGYALSDQNMHKDTQQQLNWFVKHPEYIARVVERARPYLHHIVDQLDQRNMPLEIALLPIVESGFQPFAYSKGRAAGLWQFIPGTGKVYGLKQNWWYDGRRDVVESTRAALDYLQKLHNDFGDWQLALAAYNCGEGAVARAIKKNIKAGKPTDFWSLDLPRETSAYVPKLMAVSHLIQQPDKYNLSLSPIDNSPFLSIVNVGTQIDLALAAELAQISSDELYQLNPGYNRWATMPKGPHTLVVPIEKAAIFEKALQNLPENERVQWNRHKIKSGESLGIIANRYKITIAVLKQANNLKNNRIRAGRHLLIPIASGTIADYSLTANQHLATKQNTPRKGNKKTHIVKAGDTWWDIANAYKVDVHKLTRWNSKAPRDVLQPGQKLVVWTKANSSNLGKKIHPVNYTVRNGDSLWKISQKFSVSVSQVREWNGLSNRTLLQPGQNLTLYVDVTQQSSI
ncbi:MAG: lytic transglycosylase [Methylophaga sp.]|nr:MAG: lytic transglycosylase [Methylophaga sp.]